MAGQTASDIEQIVNILSSKFSLASIILRGLLPHGKYATEKSRIYNDAVNTIISRINNVTYIDNSIEFIDLSGAINNDLMPDNLHLSKKGYEKLSKVLTPLIYRLVPKLRISNGDE